MKLYKSVLLLLSGLASIVSAYAQNNKPAYYSFNRLPLKQNVYAQLPLGSIQATGWLLTQLELQKNGFTGHAEELYPEPENLGKNSDWLGGTGSSWEKAPYYVKGLVALAYTLNDIDLKNKAQKWIDYTLDHQQENGLFGPVTMKDWWPRMPFMYALQSYYEATKDKRVIPFLSKYFTYQLANLDKDPLKDWGKSRAGDNMEIALWLYNKTGDKNLLALVDKLKAQAYPWAAIFNENQFFFYGDDFQPKHMVNVSEALKFPVIYSQISPTPYYTNAMQNGINHIMHDNGQPEGLGAGTEFMSGNNSTEGVETCSVVEWMQSLETAARIIHDATLGDELEKVAYNALPAQFSRDLKSHSYYTLPNQVQSLPGQHNFNQDYHSSIVLSPYSGFPCCRYNMHMGWPYFIKNSWLAMPNGGLAVNAYGPMTVNAIVDDKIPVKIEEITDYPFNEQINLNIYLKKSASFPLQLRIPAWCTKPMLKLNGRLLTGVKSGKMFTVNRNWKNRDHITLNFPMTIIAQKQVNNAVSIERGPLVYALKIKQSIKNIKEFDVKGFYETEISPSSAWNYGLLLDNDAISKDFTVVKSKMPENPFIDDETPVQLKVQAKLIPSWTMDYNKTAALDVPFSPVVSAEKKEEIVLVPYGSENLRLSIFPTIGKPAFVSTTYKERFDNNTADGLVVYGGGWFYKDNAIHCASNGNESSGTNGSKIVATGTNFSNFIYSADVSVNTPGNAGLIFRVTNPGVGAEAYEGYYVGLNPSTGTVELGKSSNKRWIVIATKKYPVKINEGYQLKIKAIGDNFQVFINNDDEPVIIAKDDQFKAGNIGLRTYNALTTVDNLEVRAL